MSGRAGATTPVCYPAGAAVGVLVPAPLEGPLDYLVGPGEPVVEGAVLEVGLGGRRVRGVLWGPAQGALSAERLKPIARVLPVPPLGPALRRFIDRAAAYTLTPPGQMAQLALRAPDLGATSRGQMVYRLEGPVPVRLTDPRRRVLAALEAAPAGLTGAQLQAAAQVGPGVIRGLVEAGALAAERAAEAQPYPPLFGQAPGRHLSQAQDAAAARLRDGMARGGFETVLLRGVTGSGKTEVYLEAVAACVAAGRQALVLVPELALTPAFLARVEARFGVRPAEWHHAVRPAERRRLWLAAAEGRVSLVVGARSALFLPFADLGLVVVDEEHEGSYKQEDGVLYHARDMAVLRAAEEGALAVLASATPSLESWANAAAGKYTRLDLPERFGRAVMPQIRLIDLRSDPPPKGSWLAPGLVAAVDARLAAGEQALLFLNRRGYAPLTICGACGHRMACPDCDACLVSHRLRGCLLCHQCGYTAPIPSQCPACGRSDRLSECGPGVERVAEEAARRFPGARLAVLSSDIVPSPAEMKAKLAEVAEGGADVIVGTQIVAKGHNFPKLTLVGVVDADLGLQGGDLRGAERTFQLLSQVAGRAGRADRPGQALIQTTAPDHSVMQAILSGDAEAFWAAEAEARFAAGVPPYGRMAGVVVSGFEEARVWEVARALGRARMALDRVGAELFGPAAAPLSRIRGRHRVRLLVKAPKGVALQPALRAWRAAVKVPASLRVSIDIDPQSFL
ncbi:MAG: primosomal protein N' [Pikeienuella sp.]